MIGRRSHDDAQSFEEAWNGRTPRDAHIADLVRFAEDLCEAAVVEPRLAFRDSLREQLMVEAQTALVPMPATARQPVVAADAQPVRRRIATVTAAMVASAGVVGIVASSASAVPGEMLYPVKRTVEKVELQIHRDDSSRGAFQLAQASERLAEVQRLSAEGGSAELIGSSLDDFSVSATGGSGKLFAAYSDSGLDLPIQQVNDFAAASSLDLSALSGQLPAGLTTSFEAATQAVKDLANEASALCPSCARADVGALVASVTSLAPSAAAPSKQPVKKAVVKPVTPTTSGPTPVEVVPAPPVTTTPNADVLPTVPTKVAPLAPIVQPLLGGLLGNEDQVGLVPGLLGGLLGTTPK